MHRFRLIVGLLFSSLVVAAVAQGPLPSQVSFRLKEADRILSRAERSLSSDSVASEEYKIQAAQAAAREARDKMNEIEQRYGGQYSPAHPDIVAMQDRIAKLEGAAGGREENRQQAAAAAAQQAAEAEQASSGWFARLNPYVVGLGQRGHDENKYLIPSASQDRNEMEKRLRIAGEASADLAAYRAAQLGHLATEALQETERALAKALEEFAASCREYAEADVASADQDLRHMEQFTREQEAKLAAKETFLFMDRSQFTRAQEVVDRAAGLMPTGDGRVAGLRQRLAALKQADARLRAARVADTKMRPEAYTGGDAAALRQAAEQVVLKAHPGVRMLRSAVVNAEWVQESVIEWTDTTQTALRHRTTRSLTAQVAVKKNADTLLHTVYLAQDLQAEKTWGPTYGHIMFTDPMLEANVR